MDVNGHLRGHVVAAPTGPAEKAQENAAPEMPADSGRHLYRSRLNRSTVRGSADPAEGDDVGCRLTGRRLFGGTVVHDRDGRVGKIVRAAERDVVQ